SNPRFRPRCPLPDTWCATAPGPALGRSRRLRRSAEQSTHQLHCERVLGRTTFVQPGGNIMIIHTVECTLTRRRPTTEKTGPPRTGRVTDRNPEFVPSGRVPRVARLMALAVRFEQLIRTGAVRDYAQLARLGQVSRARLTQIMNLLHLAPDIQEAILFLPRVQKGRDRIHLESLQRLVANLDWQGEPRPWDEMRAPPPPGNRQRGGSPTPGVTD